MTDQQIVFCEALVALGFALALDLRRASPAILRHPAIVGAALVFVLTMVVRVVHVRPTFVHADMLGPGFADAILDFPRENAFHPTHGQFGVFAVGAITRLFGHDTDAVFRAMQLVGAVDVLLIGVLAYRISGSPYAALLGVAAAGTSPVLMRVAASEDMHNFGLCLGLAAFVAMDVHATSRRLAPLVVATILLALLMHTRQSFYLYAPCAFLLGLARGGRSILARPAFWVAGLAVVAVLAQRAVSTVGQEGGALPHILLVLGSSELAPAVFRHHPLFDVVRFGVLPVLTVLSFGLVPWLGRPAQALFVAVVLNFVATYPCGFPSPGVELAQRLPVFGLAVVLAAVGAAFALESQVPASRRDQAAAGLASLLVLAPAFLPGWAATTAVTADYREYLAVESLLDTLPDAFTLVILPSPQVLGGHSRYAPLLRRAGKRVRVVLAPDRESAPGPRIFLEGVECWTYNFRDLTGITNETRDYRQLDFRFDQVVYGRERMQLRPPRRMRDECATVLVGASPLGPSRVLTDPEDDPPFLFYASRRVPVRFHRLRDEASP